MSSLQQKISISAGSAFLFVLVNLPQTYKLTNSILPIQTYSQDCPTDRGLLIHTLVFFILSYLSMGNNNKRVSNSDKTKHSLYGALIFYFFSSPTVYAVSTNSNPEFANDGCPTTKGLFLHSFLYFLALVFVMYL